MLLLLGVIEHAIFLSFIGFQMSYSSLFLDNHSFGDVAMQPPELSALPRKAAKSSSVGFEFFGYNFGYLNIILIEEFFWQKICFLYDGNCPRCVQNCSRNNTALRQTSCQSPVFIASQQSISNEETKNYGLVARVKRDIMSFKCQSRLCHIVWVMRKEKYNINIETFELF